MKKKYFKYFTKILVSFIVLSGCRSVDRDLIFSTSDHQTLILEKSSLVQRAYYNAIKPEDELFINELDNKGIIPGMDFDKIAFRVDVDSNVSLPLIGKVKVGGLNRLQASERIAQCYAQTLLKAPNIDVRISNMQVTILGEVTRQGNYPILREDYKLTDLIGDAQGLSANADTEDLKIFRGDSRAPVIISVSMKHYSFLANPAVRLQSGDLVYVPPKKSAIKLKNAQQYSGFIQLGLVLISTLFIIINR